MEPSKTPPAEQGRKSDEKGEGSAISFGSMFDQHSIKISFKKSAGNQEPKVMKTHAKRLPILR